MDTPRKLTPRQLLSLSVPQTLILVLVVALALAIVLQSMRTPAPLRGVIWEDGRRSENVIDLRSSDAALVCAQTSGGLFACASCCAGFYASDEESDRDAYFDRCLGACESSHSSSLRSQYVPYSSWASSFSSRSLCANPANCVRGFVGACDTRTCLQTFNLGTCVAGGLCAVLDVRCPDQRQCTGPSSALSPPPSRSSSPSGF